VRQEMSQRPAVHKVSGRRGRNARERGSPHGSSCRPAMGTAVSIWRARGTRPLDLTDVNYVGRKSYRRPYGAAVLIAFATAKCS
jgi:hypothetical protein